MNADQPLIDVQITYIVSWSLKASAWTYEISRTASSITDQPQIQMMFPIINKTELDVLKAEMDAETGASTTTYTLEIKPNEGACPQTSPETLNPIQIPFNQQLKLKRSHKFYNEKMLNRYSKIVIERFEREKRGNS